MITSNNFCSVIVVFFLNRNHSKHDSNDSKTQGAKSVEESKKELKQQNEKKVIRCTVDSNWRN